MVGSHLLGGPDHLQQQQQQWHLQRETLRYDTASKHKTDKSATAEGKGSWYFHNRAISWGYGVPVDKTKSHQVNMRTGGRIGKPTTHCCTDLYERGVCFVCSIFGIYFPILLVGRRSLVVGTARLPLSLNNTQRQDQITLTSYLHRNELVALLFEARDDFPYELSLDAVGLDGLCGVTPIMHDERAANLVGFRSDGQKKVLVPNVEGKCFLRRRTSAAKFRLVCRRSVRRSAPSSVSPHGRRPTKFPTQTSYRIATKATKTLPTSWFSRRALLYINKKKKKTYVHPEVLPRFVTTAHTFCSIHITKQNISTFFGTLQQDLDFLRPFRLQNSR